MDEAKELQLKVEELVAKVATMQGASNKSARQRVFKSIGKLKERIAVLQVSAFVCVAPFLQLFESA
jgi:hypothetical protein